jgi:endogenous inhibitor of DNA gyrase (YacG/DUF329 family)
LSMVNEKDPNFQKLLSICDVVNKGEYESPAQMFVIHNAGGCPHCEKPVQWVSDPSRSVQRVLIGPCPWCGKPVLSVVLPFHVTGNLGATLVCNPQGRVGLAVQWAKSCGIFLELTKGHLKS